MDSFPNYRLCAGYALFTIAVVVVSLCYWIFTPIRSGMFDLRRFVNAPALPLSVAHDQPIRIPSKGDDTGRPSWTSEPCGNLDGVGGMAPGMVSSDNYCIHWRARPRAGVRTGNIIQPPQIEQRSST